MDGSNVETLISGSLHTPTGIVVDYGTSRLYWADYMKSVIQSSDFSGNDLRTNVELEVSSKPWGVAVADGYLYWGASTTYIVAQFGQSTITGENNRVVYNESYATFMHLAAIERRSSTFGVQNLCDGQGCSHICAIKAKSVRCLCPDGMYMSEDDRTCIY